MHIECRGRSIELGDRRVRLAVCELRRIEARHHHDDGELRGGRLCVLRRDVERRIAEQDAAAGTARFGSELDRHDATRERIERDVHGRPFRAIASLHVLCAKLHGRFAVTRDAHVAVPFALTFETHGQLEPPSGRDERRATHGRRRAHRDRSMRNGAERRIRDDLPHRRRHVRPRLLVPCADAHPIDLGERLALRARRCSEAQIERVRACGDGSPRRARAHDARLSADERQEPERLAIDRHRDAARRPTARAHSDEHRRRLLEHEAHVEPARHDPRPRFAVTLRFRERRVRSERPGAAHAMGRSRTEVDEDAAMIDLASCETVDEVDRRGRVASFRRGDVLGRSARVDLERCGLALAREGRRHQKCEREKTLDSVHATACGCRGWRPSGPRQTKEAAAFDASSESVRSGCVLLRERAGVPRGLRARA